MFVLSTLLGHFTERKFVNVYPLKLTGDYENALGTKVGPSRSPTIVFSPTNDGELSGVCPTNIRSTSTRVCVFMYVCGLDKM